MPTDDERREVAKKLRELGVYEGYDGEIYDRAEVEDAFGLVTDDGAWYEGNGVQHLADLIEPVPKRTCQMVEVETGELADYRDTDEVIFHCTSCHAERGVFSYDVDGNVYTERPEYCPKCGAKVVG